MPGPKEEELRKLELDNQPIDESPGQLLNQTVSSKRVDKDTGKQPERPKSTRARRPRSGRSGSDSNASTKSRGH